MLINDKCAYQTFLLSLLCHAPHLDLQGLGGEFALCNGHLEDLVEARLVQVARRAGLEAVVA